MNTWRGSKLTVSIYGESHGRGVGLTADGLPCGTELDSAYIEHLLQLRRAHGGATTTRLEKDEYEILSGVYEGRTNGAPLCVFFPNRDVKSVSYNRNIPRPSHADFPAYVKYNGMCDLRGGGHFSARLTAPLVFLGAICERELKNRGILCAAAIRSVGDIDAGSFYDAETDEELLSRLDCRMPLIDESKKDAIDRLLTSLREEKNTIGGSVELCMKGLPVGLGEPFFDSLESRLSHLMFSIPAVKAVEFGKGFSLCSMRGSDAADEYNADAIKQKLQGLNNSAEIAYSNNAGGISGGLSTSMPLIMRVGFKPIPSVGQELRSVDMQSYEPVIVKTEGRHDVCAALRGACVVRSLACICIFDLLC